MSHPRRLAVKPRSQFSNNFRQKSSNLDFNPVKWSVYFDGQGTVSVSDGEVNYYYKGKSGPALVLVHGGGYSALTWSLFAEEVTKKIECRIIAIDLRGHGNTVTKDDYNLALPQLAKDLKEAILKIFENENVPVVIIGHSLGGSIGVEAGLEMNLAGLCMIDVVEGVALENFSIMHSILRQRPTSFKTISSAIQWAYHSRMTHNLDAAKVSMPGQIINAFSKSMASDEVQEDKIPAVASSESEIQKIILPDVLHEEDDAQGDNSPEDDPSTSNQCKNTQDQSPTEEEATFVEPSKYIWRIDLSKTESHWSGWFTGLSKKFLQVGAPKILLLTNVSVLDTTLTIGQMQGNFQIQVLSKSGHAIQEDVPDEVADIIATFLVRQRLAQPVAGYTVKSNFGR